jgi:hypothetical protein
MEDYNKKAIVLALVCLFVSTPFFTNITACEQTRLSGPQLFCHNGLLKKEVAIERFMDNHFFLEWEKFYDYNGYHDSGWDVCQTSDGGYIIAGTNINVDTTDVSAILLKVDENGSLQWKKKFGQEGLMEQFYSVIETPDTGFILVGYVEMENHEFQLWLLKVNQFGAKVWEKFYGTDSIGYSIQPTSTGEYIISGHTAINNNWGVFLIKTDLNGDYIWKKTFSEEECNMHGFEVIQTLDGGYIIYGIKYNSSYTISDFLIKTDGEGNKIWIKDFLQKSEYLWVFPGAVEQTSDGGFILSFTNYTIRYGDVVLVKLDSSGNLIWEKRYGGNRCDCGLDVVETMDGEFIVLSVTQSFGGTGTWLIRTDDLGNKLDERIFDDREGFSLNKTSDDGYIITGDYLLGSDSTLDVWLARKLH